MTIKLTLANGITEVFTTDKCATSSHKDFHPMICKVEVFDNGKKRRCIWWYKKITFNSFRVQQKLKELQERQ